MKRAFAVLAVSCLMAATAPASFAESKTVHWAVLLDLPGTPSSNRGAVERSPTLQLATHLEKAGFSKDRISHLSMSQPKTTVQTMLETVDGIASKMQATDTDGNSVENVLLVVVTGRGLHINRADFLQASPIADDQWRTLDPSTPSTDSPSLLSLSDFLKRLGRIPTKRQCVVFDGASVSGKAPEALTSAFGSQTLTVNDGQSVMLNRSPALNNTGDMTAFIEGVLHALRGHADANDDNSVSLLEFSQYMAHYAVMNGIQSPRTVGRAFDVFEVTRSLTSGDDEIRRSRELRDALATRLIDAARTALLLEGDFNATDSSAKGAAEYAVSSELKNEAAMLLLTVMVARGKFAEAWAESQKRKLPLLVFAPHEIEVQAGQEKYGKVTRGELIEVTEVSTGGGWARAERILKVSVQSDAEKVASRTTKGWIATDKLTADPKQTPPLPDILRPVLQP